MNNPEYIKFVLARVEADFSVYSSGSEYDKVLSILRSVKSADDILRQAYLLSGIKKLRRLAFYLIFMYKKIESNRITLDNFLENFKTDKDFLKKHFLTYYNLESAEELQEEEKETEKFIFDTFDETVEEEEIYSLSEPFFRIENAESELVNEEFKESNPLSDQELANSNHMSLVDGEVVSGSTAKGENQIPEEGDVFSLPVNIHKIDQDNLIQEPERDNFVSDSTGEKNLADFFEELDQKTDAEIREMSPQEKQKLIEKLHEEYNEQIKDIIITEENFGESFSENKAEEYPPSEDDVEKQHPVETDEEVETKLKEIEKETVRELINSDFTKYETELYTKNDFIREIFDELINFAKDTSPDYARRDELLKNLCDTARLLKDKSGTMTFEIITRIYDSIIFCFNQKFRDIVISEDTIAVFREAVNGIEKLIRGEEIETLGNTIKKVENVEKELKHMLELREEYERKKYDFGEEERKIIEDFKDNSEKEAYIHLRERILELEKIFETHIQAKDKIHPFESLRKLSSTFVVFREIVNVCGILEMSKLAHLAEAGYVFVKFIQNYRIDPFKEDVIEVFRFMIYSFKLIYLDKPVKELDTFISYLNDPVKIFHQKKK